MNWHIRVLKILRDVMVATMGIAVAIALWRPSGDLSAGPEGGWAEWGADLPTIESRLTRYLKLRLILFNYDTPMAQVRHQIRRLQPGDYCSRRDSPSAADRVSEATGMRFAWPPKTC